MKQIPKQYQLRDPNHLVQIKTPVTIGVHFRRLVHGKMGNLPPIRKQKLSKKITRER